MFISFSIEPLSGSQTRIGGYLETEYGWNKPQLAFKSPHFVRGTSLKDYTEPFDLIVIGDSFSYDEQISWINRVSIEKGLHSLFMHIDKVNIASLLNHPIFQKNPPKYLVIESTESLAFLRFKRILRILQDYQAPLFDKPLRVSNRKMVANISIPETMLLHREKKAPLIERMRIGGDYILSGIGRLILGKEFLRIRSVKVDCGSCFSNAKQHYFLAVKSNFDPKAYKLNYLPESIDGMKRLKKVVEMNSKTTFISTVFPSKINVYLPYTEYTRNPTIFVEKFITATIQFVDLLRPFRAAVNDKTTDLYLPNDHHAGPAGQEIVAREILSVIDRIQKKSHPGKLK